MTRTVPIPATELAGLIHFAAKEAIASPTFGGPFFCRTLAKHAGCLGAGECRALLHLLGRGEPLKVGGLDPRWTRWDRARAAVEQRLAECEAAPAMRRGRPPKNHSIL